MQRLRNWVLIGWSLVAPVGCAASADDAGAGAPNDVGGFMTPGAGSDSSAGGVAGSGGGAGDPTTSGAVAPPAGDTGSTPVPLDPNEPTPQPMDGLAPMPGDPATPAGPQDGDPTRPIVEAPGITCGANPSLFGLTSTNATIGGRDVHVAYPCNKHGGAPVTFILNLHGTMPSEDFKLYQVAYFSVNDLATSHNFITVAPKSVVSQWGNGDGGVDLPHLMEVIDWVYATFAELDIRQMWVAGHSWGAMYSTTFVCNPSIAEKVRGAVLQSGFGASPACADRLSVVSTAADGESVIDQAATAASHGCGAAQTSKILNNDETYWPDCSPGFTHANYQMNGKAHADYMDAELVLRIGDLINLARP